MAQLLVIHPGNGDDSFSLEFRGRTAAVRRVGCDADLERACALVADRDGKADIIALEGIPSRLRLGNEQTPYETGGSVARAATRTPVVDGSGVRPGVERWSVLLAERAHPGLFTGKRTLMVPGLNHTGLAHAMSLRTTLLRYADPILFFGLPRLPGVGSPFLLPRVAGPTLRVLRGLPLDSFLPARLAEMAKRTRSLFRWAEVLAGDVATIRALAPHDLKGKTVVVETADDADLDDLRDRGVKIAVTVMPPLRSGDSLGRDSAAAFEALLAVTRNAPSLPLSEDTYLDMLADMQWMPEVRYLQPRDVGLNRFAFVIHPLDIGFIHNHPLFRWTRIFPDSLVEPIAARWKPMYISRITGGKSPTTDQRIEGHLLALGATPREIMRRGPEFTYKRLCQAAKLAESKGARLMGLGAFTSVVGDAGITVAEHSPIAVTSGNSLTVAATLEAAKQAAISMGTTDLSRGKAMIIGATGSIGAVCSRMIAQAIRNVVLVSIEPEKLIELKRQIQRETSGAHVTVATKSRGLVEDCDYIVTATSGFGQRIVDISECKPGAIICDVARPPDISEAEATLRPDVLVIESGEVLIPGDIDFHYDIGLPPKVSYACLAETALLAMEGRFESFTLGRQLNVDRVKEIYRLFGKHGFRLAGLRSLGKYQTEEDLAKKRELAEHLRRDPEALRQARESAAERIKKIPASSKGVHSRSRTTGWLHRPWFTRRLDAMAARIAENGRKGKGRAARSEANSSAAARLAKKL